MNKFFMMTLAAAALLTSCTKEDNDAANNSESSMSVKLTYGSDENSTYAVDDPLSATGNTKLQTAILFEMTGNNVFKAIQLSAQQVSDMTTKTEGCRIENINSMVNAVLIVGNPPSGEVTNLLALKTRAAIEAHPMTVETQQKATAGNGVTNVTIMGYETTTDGTPTAEGHNIKKVTVTVKPVVGRMEVAGKVNISGAATNNLKSVTFTDVYFTRYCTTLKKDIILEHHEDTWATIPVWAKDAYSDETINKAKCHSYQFFPSSKVGAENLPIIVMKANIKVTENGIEVPKEGVYITIKKYKKADVYLTQMSPNVIYKVDLGQLTLSHEDFTEEPNPGQTDLDVKVDIAPWTVENITPEV